MDTIEASNFNVHHLGDGVAHLEINRARSFNSFDENTWLEYESILFKLDELQTITIIIVSGIGDTFSSGLDVKFMLKKFQAFTNNDQFLKFLKIFQRCISTPLRIGKPTIGLIHGTKNFGLALDLLCCYSMRIFTKDVTFSLKEIQLGLIPDMGVLERLAKQTQNVSLLMKLALTGCKFGIEEVLELGLVSKKDVAENYQAGLEMAKKLANSISIYQGWCINGVKKSIEEVIENDVEVSTALENVIKLNVNNFETQSFVAKIGKSKL
ncbi:hypothetical protein CANARDRAFT_195772 [[Candida] arabinofermentans NRRL YB-2248]|uniref:3-hydroxyisobutyryl-CoA hydrolase, mitochondrial n=1 Tax=[Candida] arabinofermentans NRRL YB-2248 TaxID=983967 RepID=A0A1E4T5U4_9ASCO|nr:hypothetical protein CANARDRAFT_195772 [[Candida] arabinofermentans NRRL YB-2248]